MMNDSVIREVTAAIDRTACEEFLRANAERVDHFKRRVGERGDDPADVVIVVLDMDDQFGGEIVAALMPAFDPQPIRDRGEKPVARGLAGREGIQEAIDLYDPSAGDTLRCIGGIAIVAVSCGAVVVSHG